MSYYRPIYQPETVDEESLLQHRLALAGQNDVMELARLTRMRDVEFTSSFMRYAQPRVAGMYQELTTVYGEQCTNPPVTQQSSFESEEGFPTQSYRVYPYGSSEVRIPAQEYISSSDTLIGEASLRQITAGPQSIASMPVVQESQRLDHDLPTVFSRSDMQWLTTSSTDMRTQSPLNTSSPRPKMPPLYPSQPTPPNVSLLQQGSLDDSPSNSAAMGRHQFRPQTYASASGQSAPPPTRSKKATSSSNPPKPKGTPGRKRKFQDHELTPEEATKRRVRRERNKVAAAKCRNRRRELTDRLQGETDHLEDHQSFLHQEILTLQQEKEHLEFILAAHSTNCKAGGVLSDSASLIPDNSHIIDASRMTNVAFTPSLPVVEEMMGETDSDSPLFYLQSGQSSLQTPQISSSRNATQRTEVYLENPAKVENASKLESHSIASGNVPTDLSNHTSSYPASTITTEISRPIINLDNIGEHEESLNTPVCTLATPLYSPGVFSFSLTPTVCNTTTEPSFLYPSSTSILSSKDNLGSPRTPSYNRGLTPQSCSVALRRRSSSDSHNSPDSVKSHSLIAL